MLSRGDHAHRTVCLAAASWGKSALRQAGGWTCTMARLKVKSARTLNSSNSRVWIQTRLGEFNRIPQSILVHVSYSLKKNRWCIINCNGY